MALLLIKRLFLSVGDSNRNFKISYKIVLRAIEDRASDTK